MPSAGFEPAISVSKGPQTHALDRAAIGTEIYLYISLQFIIIYAIYEIARTRTFMHERTYKEAKVLLPVPQPGFTNSLQSGGRYMYRQFNIQQFYVLPTLCVYVLCVDLRTNSDYFPIQH